MRSTAGSCDEWVTITEIITPSGWQRYENETLVSQKESIPLVKFRSFTFRTSPFHFNIPEPATSNSFCRFRTETNTRLCDRAHRITMQSFKMYLGKGIDGFTDLPVAPGRMWVTDNDSADVIEFGGDPSSPSEDQHITDLREAMDKVSAVTPIAAGAIRDRIGNLPSAAALRVALMALLARTERKRTVYGGGITHMCELAAGVAGSRRIVSCTIPLTNAASKSIGRACFPIRKWKNFRKRSLIKRSTGSARRRDFAGASGYAIHSNPSHRERAILSTPLSLRERVGVRVLLGIRSISILNAPSP